MHVHFYSFLLLCMFFLYEKHVQGLMLRGCLFWQQNCCYLLKNKWFFLIYVIFEKINSRKWLLILILCLVISQPTWLPVCDVFFSLNNLLIWILNGRSGSVSFIFLLHDKQQSNLTKNLLQKHEVQLQYSLVLGIEFFFIF